MEHRAPFLGKRTRLFASRSILLLTLLLLGTMSFFVPTAQAAVTCTTASLTTSGSAYVQNFDTLSNTAGSTTNETLPAGWCLTEAGGGARDNEQYGVDTGGSTTGDTYSYGAAGSTERAFGSLQSGTLIPTIGAAFVNNTGCTIATLDVAYTGEEWRLGTAGRNDQYNFEYSTNAVDLTTGTWTSISALSFTTPDTATTGAKNGNAAGERIAVSSTITGLSIANGATFRIHWVDFNASGADDGLAVDDFSLTPTCAVTDLAPTVTATIPSNGATNVVVTDNLSVTFSEPVTVTGNWLQLVCTSSGTRNVSDFTVTGGPSVFTLNPTTDLSASETCTLIIFAAQVADQDGTPDNMAGNAVASFTTAAPLVITPIHDIQGPGASSPVVGSSLTIEGIVTADFETSTYLSGFYVQEEDADVDADPLTSEGIFVYNGASNSVNVGDKVRVTGVISEFTSVSGGHTSSLTEITVSSLSIISTGNVIPTAASLTFPMNDTTREYSESMRVVFTNTMTVAEVFQLGRYGQIVLHDDTTPSTYSVVGHVPLQYTQTFAPSVAGYNAALAELETHSIYLDDGRTGQNPDPILFGDGGNPLSAGNTLRIGDSVAGLTGVLDERYEGYRIQAMTSPNFSPTNPRPGSPSVTGDIRVASFNLLNYFNGPNFSDPNNRGANNLTEFNRQTDKEVSSIIGLNADVYGLMEMENDSGSGQAIESLVNALNASAGAGTFAYIDTGTVGSDAIRVALIYRPSVVQPVGTFYTDSVDYPFNTNTRPPLAQMFQVTDIANPSYGETFIVVVNHLKSKSTAPCGSGANADLGDGQGCWNGDRVAGAAAMTAWVNSVVIPAYGGEPDVLLIGDFNSYGSEDPIGTIMSAGYNYLTGGTSYSYVFDGQRGTLDQAFVSASLYPQLGGVTEWHINSDEPSVLDYNTEFKSAGQISSLYSSGPYRTSDHDPILLGLSLSSPHVSITTTGATLAENAVQSVTVTLTTPSALTSDLTVPLQINGAGTTATQNVDFSLSAPSVTFPSGSANGAIQSITLTILDDSILEGDETVTIEFGAPISGASPAAPTSVAFTIDDDETASLSFSAATSSTAEASGAAFTVPVELTVVGTTAAAGTLALPGGQTIDIDVILDTPAGTATSGTDYTFTTQTLSFSAVGTVSANLPIIDDGLLEADETVNLTLLNPVAPVGVTAARGTLPDHTATITDDETAVVNLTTSAAASVDEATAPTLNAVLTITDTTAAAGDSALDTGITVSVDAVDAGTGTATNGADYTFTSPQTITFTGTTLSVPLAYALIDDGALEGNETVDFVLQNLVNSLPGQVTYGTTTSLTTTITDDETATVSFGAGPVDTGAQNEATASYNIPVVLTITATTGTPTLQVQVDVNVAVDVSSTATNGVDFTLTGSPITFAVGSVDGASQNASINVTDDAAIEGPETVVLTLNGAASAVTFSNTPYTFTINDDDGATISFTLGSDTVPEAQTSYNLIAVLNIPGGGTLASPATVDLSLVSSTASNGVDFSFSGPITLTFPAGSGNGATVNQPITLIPDANIESPENLVFGLGNLQGLPGVTLGSQSQFTLNITDDDGATVSFGAPSATTPESETTVTIPVTLTVPNSGLTLDIITVQVSVSGGSATNGAAPGDYEYSSPQTVSFPAGSGTTSTTVSVTIHGDTAAEGDETVDFSLGALTGTGVTLTNPQTYTLTITDDDVAGVIQFQQAASTVMEATAGTVNIPVILSGGTITSDVVFTVSDMTPPTGSATPGGVDYTFVDPSPLTFPTGSTTGTIINIPVNITADSSPEGSETIVLTLAVTSGGTLGTNITHTITIQESGSSGGGSTSGPTPTPIPNTVFLCDNLIAQTNGEMMASGAINNVSLNGQVGNTYCRIIARSRVIVTSAAEIGLPQVLNLGVVHAINVYGLMSGGTPVVPFTSPVRLCMRGTGDILFISAADVGRALTRLGGNTSVAPGYTCVNVPNSGLVVMVNGSSGMSEASSAPSNGTDTPLTACQVRTTNQVNLRSTPVMNGNGNVLAVLPYDITLTATAYNSLGWYQVIYENMQGYVNHSYLTTIGSCGG